jgi:NADPH:quinone reductase-like Zn-dependent oxidoreductase
MLTQACARSFKRGYLADYSYLRFPYKIGYDLAGVVVAVGSAVKNFKPGDSVYSRTKEIYRGSVAEYALSTEGTTAMKPKCMYILEPLLPRKL